jgi:hypothetical protein
MPVTRSRNGMHEMLSLDQTNTARFLFGEDEGSTTSPDVNNYLDMNATENNFPILVRNQDYPSQVSSTNASICAILTATCSFPLPLLHLTLLSLNPQDLNPADGAHSPVIAPLNPSSLPTQLASWPKMAPRQTDPLRTSKLISPNLPPPLDLAHTDILSRQSTLIAKRQLR